MKNLSFLIIILFHGLISCNSKSEKLPIIGNRDFDGKDTIYPKIPDFSFIDQDSQIITNQTFKDKIYVADFFFTSCPTICPKVTRQMLRVYKEFENDDRVLQLAHSIDVKHDTIPKLKKYADNLNVKSNKWHFVTGEKENIFDIANYYFSVAKENPDSPGGFDHSGRLILVDKNRHIRSFCDGTNPESVDQFILDIKQLLNEK